MRRVPPHCPRSAADGREGEYEDARTQPLKKLRSGTGRIWRRITGEARWRACPCCPTPAPAPAFGSPAGGEWWQCVSGLCRCTGRGWSRPGPGFRWRWHHFAHHDGEIANRQRARSWVGASTPHPLRASEPATQQQLRRQLPAQMLVCWLKSVGDVCDGNGALLFWQMNRAVRSLTRGRDAPAPSSRQARPASARDRYEKGKKVLERLSSSIGAGVCMDGLSRPRLAGRIAGRGEEPGARRTRPALAGTAVTKLCLMFHPFSRSRTTWPRPAAAARMPAGAAALLPGQQRPRRGPCSRRTAPARPDPPARWSCRFRRW